MHMHMLQSGRMSHSGTFLLEFLTNLTNFLQKGLSDSFILSLQCLTVGTKILMFILSYTSLLFCTLLTFFICWLDDGLDCVHERAACDGFALLFAAVCIRCSVLLPSS